MSFRRIHRPALDIISPTFRYQFLSCFRPLVSVCRTTYSRPSAAVLHEFSRPCHPHIHPHASLIPFVVSFLVSFVVVVLIAAVLVLRPLLPAGPRRTISDPETNASIMQAQSRPRKRAAPGTSPTSQHRLQQQQDTVTATPQIPFQYAPMQDSPFNNSSTNNDALASYRNPLGNDPTNPYDNFDTLDPNFYNTALNTAQPPTFGANMATPSISPNPVNPSNQLVRRDTNQQLATRTPQRNHWSNITNHAANTENHQRLSEKRVWEDADEDGGDQNIDTRAALAKKDAQAKRKQIPPFVQKLSRYVYKKLHCLLEEHVAADALQFPGFFE